MSNPANTPPSDPTRRTIVTGAGSTAATSTASTDPIVGTAEAVLPKR